MKKWHETKKVADKKAKKHGLKVFKWISKRKSRKPFFVGTEFEWLNITF